MTEQIEGKTENMIARLVRLPAPLNEWLDSYATVNGFSSTPDLIRHIAREFRQANKEQA